MKKILMGLVLSLSISADAGQKTHFDSCFCELTIYTYTIKGLKIIGNKVEIVNLGSGSSPRGEVYSTCKMSIQDLVSDNICPSQRNY